MIIQHQSNIGGSAGTYTLYWAFQPLIEDGQAASFSITAVLDSLFMTALAASNPRLSALTTAVPRLDAPAASAARLDNANANTPG